MPVLFTSDLSFPDVLLRVYGTRDALTRLQFVTERSTQDEGSNGQYEAVPKDDLPLFQDLRRQLAEYFNQSRRKFTLPVRTRGTVFQEEVWRLLSEIPYGETRSYGELAQKLGHKNKARAVGGAAHVNPLPILVPCHRLVGSTGALTGFAAGLEVKEYLLRLEGALKDGRFSMPT